MPSARRSGARPAADRRRVRSASAGRSARKASTSAGRRRQDRSGRGSSRRSKVAPVGFRRRERDSARSSRARMKRSIGFRAQPGLRDLRDWPACRRNERPVRLAGRTPGRSPAIALAPWSIQSRKQLDLGLGKRRPFQGHALGLPFAPHGDDERALLAAGPGAPTGPLLPP